MYPLERVHCTYHDVGCEDVILHKNQKKHNEESSETRLQLLLSELTNTKQKLAATEQMLSATNDNLADIQLKMNSTKKT